MDMKISGLPDPPKGFENVVEWRILRVGDAALAEPNKSRWFVVNVKTHGVDFMWRFCLYPAPLKGTDWLDAQRRGTAFEFKKRCYLVKDINGKVIMSATRSPAFYVVGGGWKDLDLCFPDGYKDLSNETCDVLFPRKDE